MDVEDISEAYERFIKVNSEVANEIVPIKPKKVYICPSTIKLLIKPDKIHIKHEKHMNIK